MWKKLWEFIKAAFAVLFWAVFFEILHHYGWYPETWLAGLVITAPSAMQQSIFLWSLTLLLSAAILFVEHWFPRSWHFLRKSPVQIPAPPVNQITQLPTELERIPLVALFVEAQNNGFDFLGEGMPILDFSSLLRQSGLDEELTFWGRPRRYKLDDLIRREPLNIIPADHWKDFEINWAGAVVLKPPRGEIVGFATDNFAVGSQTSRRDRKETEGYCDLYINKAQALRWLEKNKRTVTSEFIAMKEAATRMYEQLRANRHHSGAALWVEAADRSRSLMSSSTADADGKLIFFSHHIGRKIPVRGKCVPSRVSEDINKREIGRNEPFLDGDAISLRDKITNAITYTDLEVKPNELSDLIDAMKNQYH